MSWIFWTGRNKQLFRHTCSKKFFLFCNRLKMRNFCATLTWRLRLNLRNGDEQSVLRVCFLGFNGSLYSSVGLKIQLNYSFKVENEHSWVVFTDTLSATGSVVEIHNYRAQEVNRSISIKTKHTADKHNIMCYESQEKVVTYLYLIYIGMGKKKKGVFHSFVAPLSSSPQILSQNRAPFKILALFLGYCIATLILNLSKVSSVCTT